MFHGSRTRWTSLGFSVVSSWDAVTLDFRIFNEMIQNCNLLLLLNKSGVVTLLPFYYLCVDISNGLILEIIFSHPFFHNFPRLMWASHTVSTSNSGYVSEADTSNHFFQSHIWWNVCRIIETEGCSGKKFQPITLSIKPKFHSIGVSEGASPNSKLFAVAWEYGVIEKTKEQGRWRVKYYLYTKSDWVGLVLSLLGKWTKARN